ncbi:MAG: hypothetical protein WA555_10230 [Candidatus Sulfotelmatobacter sp.]
MRTVTLGLELQEVAITIAILSFFGVVIGASLQYVFTRYLDNQRHHRDLRTQAYLDHLNSVSGLAHLSEPQGSQERDLLAKAADAKGRICLNGSREVVHAFAVFEKLGAVVSSVQQRAAFVAMVIAMRNDSGNRTELGTGDVGLVLLGSRD